MKIEPAQEPLVQFDATQLVLDTQKSTEPTHTVRFLWPFRFWVSTMKSGSKMYQIEFRPLVKFSLSVLFFWKRGSGE